MADLTVGKEGPLILKFAVPMLLGNVFQQTYSIVNSIIIGNYVGKTALAAVGASFPIIFLLISLIIGIGIGFSVIISQYFGAKKIDQVRKTIDTMYIFLFFTSIIISILGVIFSEDVLRLTRLPEEIIPQASTYLRIYILGMIFFFGFNGTSSALRGLGDSKTPLYFLIIANITNICLDLILIGIFKLGVEGAAISTIISQAGAFFTMIWYLNKRHDIVKLNIRKLRFDNAIFKKSIQIGLPTGLQQTFVSLGMLALNFIVNPFGTDTIAAYTIAGRIDSFAALPAMNFAAALSSFVGQNLGANKPERVKHGLISTFLMTSIVSVLVSAVALIWGRGLMHMFTPDRHVIEIGYQYLVIVSSFYLFFSTMFIIGGVMRGAGDTLIPMFITLFALWVIRIPLAYIMAPKYGVIGIWWAIPIAWGIGMSCSYIYYLTGRWKKKVVLKYKETNTAEVADKETVV
ncbi:MAG: MATE family efflux transporter [Bacteroidetes bacterium]|nr:MATE family efflux transporter [Bacteroidota bacterium]